jgi:hypothetical protein
VFLGALLKLKFLVSIAGPTGVFAPGDITDWKDSKDAQRLVDAGFAEKVAAKKTTKKETAAETKAAETAALDE